MSLASIVFLGIILAAIVAALLRLRSEKDEPQLVSPGIGLDFPTAGDPIFSSASHDAHHNSGCDIGVSHDGTAGDCHVGGFDGGSHH
jgi:hypothetical protein